MMKTSDLKNKWENLKGQNGFLQRLDPEHPMDFFIGISAEGYEEIALFTDVEPALLNSSKTLEIEKNQRKDGKWATQIYSTDSKNRDIFSKLCLDLVECSQNCISENDGLSRVTKRYFAWQRLFARLNESLPKSVLKGLIGEIDFVKILIKRGYSKDEAISAWMGPDGADRDFTLGKTWIENKAISTGRDKVKISSLNQLEAENTGYLTIVNIDDASSMDEHAFSVKKYIDKFREEISDAPNASMQLEQKLVSIGYIDKNIYDNIYFSIGMREGYLVNDKFPKLVTANVPKEIVDVEYGISIPSIKKWKVEEN